MSSRKTSAAAKTVAELPISKTLQFVREWKRLLKETQTCSRFSKQEKKHKKGKAQGIEILGKLDYCEIIPYLPVLSPS